MFSQSAQVNKKEGGREGEEISFQLKTAFTHGRFPIYHRILNRLVSQQTRQPSKTVIIEVQTKKGGRKEATTEAHWKLGVMMAVVHTSIFVVDLPVPTMRARY